MKLFPPITPVLVVKMSNKVKKRVFIVGSPRSGTTLLQGILAAHPEVYSLPETFFFALVRPRRWIKRHLLWPAIKVRKHLLGLIHEMKRDDLLPLAHIGIFQRDYYAPFVAVMDRMTIDAGKSIWVEKTPWHLYCIDEIQKCIPDAIIIHIVRNGLDNVASIVDATQNHPQQWAKLGGKRWKNWKGYSVAQAVDLWNKNIAISKAKAHAPGNIVIRYEEIIAAPEVAIPRLCEAVGIDFCDAMMNPAAAVGAIVRPDEPWKANNAHDIGHRKSKVDALFSPAQIQSIKDSLSAYEL